MRGHSVTQARLEDIYVHVPKTAGTSLCSLLALQPRRISYTADIPPGTDPDIAAQMVTRTLAARPAIVIGHFTVDAFAQAEEAQSARFLTVLRDPLARMYSHYRFLNEWGLGRTHPQVVPWANTHPSDLPFTDFALAPALQNFQAQYGGEDLARYEVVGITERFAAFVRRLGLVNGSDEVRHDNRSSWGGPIHPAMHDPGFVRDFAGFHAIDYSLYEAAASIAP